MVEQDELAEHGKRQSDVSGRRVPAASSLEPFTSSEPLSAPNPALLAEGWERRFIAAGPRLREFKELYRQMGYEVLVERVGEDELPDDCRGCQAAVSLFMIIYTRRE